MKRFVSIVVAAAFLGGCASTSPVSESRENAASSTAPSGITRIETKAASSQALLANATPTTAPAPASQMNTTRPVPASAPKGTKSPPGETRSGGRIADAQNAAVFDGLASAILGRSVAAAAGRTDSQSFAIGAAVGGVTGTRVVAQRRATERQRQIAERRARTYSKRVPSWEVGTAKKTKLRYIAVDTIKDERTSPKAAKSLMIYDRQTEEIVGNSVYDVQTTPRPGTPAKFDFYSAEYVGSGG